MIDPTIAAKIARTLTDEGLGGNQLERLIVRLSNIVSPPVMTINEWCAANASLYLNPHNDGGTRPIAMIKAVRDTFGCSLVDAKAAVDAARSEYDLKPLRDKLSV
jgi:hypothetical protein